MNLVQVLQIGGLALRILQARLITVVCLIMTFALFAYAMWQPDVLRIIVAAAWGLSIFLPVLWRTGHGGYDGATQVPGSSEHPEGEAPSG